MATPRGSQTETEDGEIIAALQDQDRRRALTLLMRRDGERVYRYAFAMTRDRQLAEEVRQQVFIEAYRDLGTFAGRGSVRAWLFGIARNRCLDATKTNWRWGRRFKNEPPDFDDEAPTDDDPGHRLDRGRLAAIVARCLQRLAPAAREAVVLRYHQELSYDEASKVAGALPCTLQQRAARALPVLRRCVDAQLSKGETR
jgi:RNA polymerase sigma-70 factor (ECF subfamily)